MRKHSRRFSEALQKVEKNKFYSPLDGLHLMKNLSNINFIETAEIHIVLGLDPKYADQQLRATVILPKGTGKIIRVAVVTNETKTSEAILAGADIAGGKDLIEEITKGRLDFDKLIATPDVMLSIAKLGKILGPKGLMPSPKAGTITNDLTKTIKEFKSGKLEYRVDRTGILHIPFGKLNFTTEELYSNLITLQQSIDKNRPQGAKGKYWKTAYISSTMGPSIPLNINLLRDNYL
uniref:Ribosomal protein n=2 Tax=Gracilariopsis TaxID=2781 RepID=A0A1C9CF26_9FLOR|nr:ribosomal protein L1 [Gracilariopsis lemaneiformis]YP_009294748.1 ribosomal protein L1 [Gracilariopsis chorda]AJO68389.1 ribosomal protein L1 [Gracilariopsis lemaneiformis]AML79876.1 ribosomal protein L1 [Gracilariopsis lemaneiformis]AOM67008.1 ribosomal protein L1 [Gracilariopsis chorda]